MQIYHFASFNATLLNRQFTFLSAKYIFANVMTHLGLFTDTGFDLKVFLNIYLYWQNWAMFFVVRSHSATHTDRYFTSLLLLLISIIRLVTPSMSNNINY